MRNFNLTDKNTFYAPANDECWIYLAQELINGYASSYSNLVAINARTQSEYDSIDKASYMPQRKSILKRVKHGPLRNVVDIHSIYHGFEQKRLEYKRSWGIYWKDNNDINLDDL